MRLTINQTWNGHPLATGDHTRLDLVVASGMLHVVLDAPFHNDAPPPRPPGPTDHLWDYEVVELFLLGTDTRYLEIELGPHGHYLVLLLHGIRRRVSAPLPIEFTARIEQDKRRWSGHARIPLAHVPPGLHAVNAYALHGSPGARHHLAAYPVPGETPDFHQPTAFGPLHLPVP